MLKQTRFMFVAAFAALTMSACGGGSLSGETAPDDGDDATPKAASLTLFASSPQMSSDASSSAKGVTLTAIVKDSNNNVVADVPVVFSTSESGTLIPLTSDNLSDDSGEVKAILTTGGDPENRSITVTATSGDLKKQVIIKVIGTTMSITGPDSTQFNQPTQYVVQLTDAAGKGVSGQTVSFSTEAGNSIAPGTVLETDSAGQVQVTLTATRASSSLTVTALGITQRKQISVSTDQFTFLSPGDGQEVAIGSTKTVTVQWLQSGAPVADGTTVNFTATRGTLSATNATTSGGKASVTITSARAGFSTITASSTALTKPTVSRTFEFVAVTPARVDLDASPAKINTNESSEISATVRDANNNLVKNAIVEFNLDDVTTGNISAGSATTNGQGVAKVTYQASSQTSATDGVLIRGVVSGTAIEDQVTLTVGARAVDITLGTGSQIVSLDAATYQLPIAVIVQDSGGNPVSDARVTLRLEPVSYFKGDYANAIDTNGDGAISRSESLAVMFECPNEDINLNDLLEAEEDVNGSQELEPGRVATIETTVTLDRFGHGTANITYPKRYGMFVKFRAIGTVSVTGSESTTEFELVLSIAEGDADNLESFSPFGLNDCDKPD